jgi:hypothetical protein
VKIPEASLKQSIAVIGRTGSGKTYTAKGLVEHQLRAMQRVLIVDPLGVWWGLRSSADGKSPAFPVVVFGGDHADVPLTEGMGAALAETLAGQNLPSIVDVSEFSMAGRVRFMTTFLEELYAENRSPLTLVIDEADMFAPQRPQKDQLTMLGRMEQICRRGRVRGFRPWLITQRPASLHKSVLSQANTLIAMQLTAPQDRDALGDWIEGQADRVEGKRILAELPKLTRGEGFVWAPHEGVLERVKFPPITTYDSSRAPEDGEQLPQVKLAPVDLSEISELLRSLDEDAGAAVDEADTRQLQARIRELEEQLDQAPGDSIGQEEHDRAIAEAEIRGYERGRAEASATLHVVQHSLQQACATLQREIEAAVEMPPAEQAPAAPRHIPAPRIARGPGEQLSKAERLILTALAQYRQGRTKTQVALLTRYSSTGGGFNNAISALRSAGRLEGMPDALRITAAGLKALGRYDPLPTGRALLDHWLRKGSKCERKILETLAESYPRSLSKAQVANRAGYEAEGGGFNNGLSRLRTLELIRGRAELRASDDFFQGAGA